MDQIVINKINYLIKRKSFCF